MARSDPTIYMRLPQELKDMLDEASATNRRSLTAEVVARLQASFETEAKERHSDLHAAIDRLQDTLNKLPETLGAKK